jgi:hypothetical protein
MKSLHERRVLALDFFENERDRVDTPALVSGDVISLALKDMAKV